MKKVTMQDIADQLNISKNSVSQALRGKEGVSSETKRLIIETAEKLGYQYPNKNLETTPSSCKSIAFIASDFSFSFALSTRNFFSEIYLSIQDEIHTNGWDLLLHSVNNEQKDSLTLPLCIQNKKVDGIIVLSHISDEYIQKLIDSGIPTIIIDHHYPGIQADCLLTNNRFGAFQAIQHLIELGHEKIGFMGNIDYSPSYQERLEGYHLALKKANITANKTFILDSINETAEDVFSQLSSLREQPTAWFCVNDGLSFYTCSYLQQNQFQIPKDISLCSYDNGELSRLITPKVTTLDIDLTYYGKCAFDLLIWRMENPTEPYREILLPSKLIKRDSTGLAPER